VNTVLAEIIAAALDSRANGAHFALPGKVVSYSASAQTATVRVGVRRAVPTDVEGTFTYENLPDITDVQVVWPRGNGQHFAPGLTAGDGVLLVICDLDPSTWIRTGAVSDPADLRKSDLAHAVCIPGFVPSADALSPSARDLKVADAEIGGTSDAAAKGSVVNAILAAIAGCTPAGSETGLAAIKAALSAYTESKSDVLKIGS